MTCFADVAGHERAIAFVRAAARADRLAHALLFAGPDGVGKRTLALALAAWMQCQQRDDDACGECSSCRQITAASHPDVVVVSVATGKKEIGVDRAREIKRFAQLQPVDGIAKVVIVDNAHTLTVAAQNALLKTLEEPPAHSFLVLVANNPDALLPTVRSRTQRVHFGPLAMPVLVDLVRARLGVDADSAARLAVAADGSVGRALALGRLADTDRRDRLVDLLAGVREARYVRLARMAHELNHPESEIAVKLDLLLARAREAVEQAVASTDTTGRPDATLRRRLQDLELLFDAAKTLQRGAANRQLFLEALLLQLGRP